MNSMPYPHLFTPMSIGGVELKNRISMAPMGMSGLVTSEGGFTKRGMEYFVERARGGVGLLITGCAKVENEIEPFVMPSQPNPTFNPAHFRQTAMELTERVHAYGCRIFLQMTLGFGRVVHPHTATSQPIAPSPVPNFWDPSISCRALTTEEVEQLIESFAEAAVIARVSGFDGIEVHAVHEGYLLDQFTLKAFNQRSDRFGGDLNGRLTLPIELLKRTKELAGSDYPVMLRYGVKTYMKGLHKGILPGEDAIEMGRDIEEGLQVARILEQAGYDAFNADGGSYDSWYWAHPPMYLQDGSYLHLTKPLKEVLSVPVISAGKLGDPDVAERAISEGRTDGVSLGRPLLTDPFWADKVRKNDISRIRPCVGCHEGCLKRIALCNPLCCAVNPQVGREREYDLKPTLDPRKILVIGGGLAGMEAARVAASRGHQVTLYEATEVLGGHIVEGSVPSFKDDDKKLLAWYRQQIEDAGVVVHLGQRLSVDQALDKNAEAIVVATGSTAVIPPIPGLNPSSPHVLSTKEALMGLKKIGKRVAIIGGGLVGCEIAMWIAQDQKHSVTLIEQLPELISVGDVPRPNKTMLLDLLNKLKVDQKTDTKVVSVQENSLTIESDTTETILCDSIILATGYRPDNHLYHKLRTLHPEVYIIGDAVCPINIKNAIWNAYEIAREI
ncbi:FAD-dependent oxidoreductase [Dethiosulfovibrio sp. F2B]|uniref:oxidoreductase n=1 Tax=Dethiosulfovibrio faecalis TaxID=2720018 RepID=UPI001F37CDF2|nr:FAD-dependent oxidoreductase [Dethiosulfovibrio faecalis]MCF4152395.1 FAD-dependent oxidoreductase [Dethiosulfovibrio faecalis]